MLRPVSRISLHISVIREGRLQELDRAVDQCPRGEMLVWFSVRMFEEACLHNRLETVSAAKSAEVRVGSTIPRRHDIHNSSEGEAEIQD